MFTLIDLPYSQSALEPVISAQTLSFHHGKHLQAYVDNLNKLIAGTEFESMTLEQIVISSAVEKSKAIFNNAGQILNHNLYFTQFCRSVPELVEGPTAPTGPLKTQIESQWGTLDAFQKEFVAKGVGLFGSGWVWLQADAAGALSIGQYPGADNPICHRSVPEPVAELVEVVEGPAGVSVGEPVEPPKQSRLKPLLTFDVWEHAYYLDYQNRRAAHLEALWGIVDWGVIERRYQESKQ